MTQSIIDPIVGTTAIPKEYSWTVEVFVVVFITLLISLIGGILLKKIETKLATKTKTEWDESFFEALRKPFQALIWVIGLSYAVELTADSTKISVLEAVGPIREVAIIVIIGWFLLRFIRKAEENYIKNQREKDKKFDRTTANAVAKLLRLTVIITIALVVLQTLGFSIGGVLAFGGVGGVAVGFAAKDLLANFFGGMMIYLDRPFKVGDWVRSPDRNIEGTVETIGWRLTSIITFDNRPLYIPNSLFSTIIVENPSRMSHRRIYETIGIRYDDMQKAATITNAVKEMLTNHEAIDNTQTLMVQVAQFGSSSVDFIVYAFTKTTSWVEFQVIKEEILLKIAAIVDMNEAEFAFPTSTIHVPEIVQLESRAGTSHS